jgi:predicted PhzF superfamily epimerase YddE/YHI9
VHSLDIIGALTIYQRRHAGATYQDPSSFQVGRVVARYDMTLQDVLAVYASQQGIPTLTGDMVQTAARQMSGSLAGRTFGRQGLRLRFFATGLGILRDPVTLNADLEIAGNWSIE